MTSLPITSRERSAREQQTTVVQGPIAPAQKLLKELLTSRIILADDWENLPDTVRGDLSDCIAKKDLLHLLVDHQLLTEYQAGRIEAGKTHGLVLGNYRILDRLGAGAMGVVFKAEHVRMRRPVAIKVLPCLEDVDNRVLRRFLGEMRTLAQLQHPNIINAIDDGEIGPTPSDPGLYFFVMEYVPGHDLEHLVAEQGPLPVHEAASLIYQVASALAEAHAHNLVHRDIKPSNIRVTTDGQAKLLDFGLVRHFHHRLTEQGTVLGTLDYLSPEQARDASSVDIRADIYSLGGTLFWCLTGRVPFPESGIAAETLVRRLSQKPPSLRVINPDLPAELDSVIQRMMACNPDDRYPTPQAVMNALLGFLRTDAKRTPQEPALTGDPRLKPLPENDATCSAHRVLVVDDSRMVRIYCTRTLQEDGKVCTQADNGLEALTAVGAKPFDLILTDWVMPGMTGLELCRRLRESSASPNLKIIVFSSQITDDDVAQVLAAGADDYLTGKFTPVQLLARVNAALRLKDAQDRSELLNRHLLACNRQLEESLQSRDSDLVQIRGALVLALTDLVCQRDVESIFHVMRVQRYGRVLAEEVTGIPGLASQIDRNFIQMLECCAPLHDIGKIGLPDTILGKAGNLNVEERQIMQTHTTIGAETLQNVAKRHGSAVAFLQMAIDIARHHHERFDGQGYPDRLAGNDIPLAARIVAIADVYDGLRTRRAYKPALSHAAALQVMFEGSHGQFDPLLMQAFQRCAPQFEQICSEIPG
jgi:response regulator RpfG family c-di-GMP phosphodiesterase/serine/threonine protein kinase